MTWLLYTLFLSWFAPNQTELPEGFKEEKIADGLDPTRLAIAPDGRIFVVEKNGRVLIFRDDKMLEEPFVDFEVDNFNERGLSGIAFHPDFEANNFVYFYYTSPQKAVNVIVRITANGDFAIPGSEEVIFEVGPLRGTIHNAGDMSFGPDGKLYISTGDGADAQRSQDLTSMLGKVLRINDDGSIPEDNPFFNSLEGDARSIYAYGLRNPFSMAIDIASGRIYTGDVGSNKFEEINEITPGSNHGWDVGEGVLEASQQPANHIDPVYAYSHQVGCSVIGAEFYSPERPSFPEEYHGLFFFADYCQGWIRMLNPESGEVVGTFASGINRPVAFRVTPDGDMYYLERNGLGGGSMTDNTSSNNGVLWKISYTGSGAPFISEHPTSALVSVGESVNFSVGAGGAPDLTYQWFINGEAIVGETNRSLTIEDVPIELNGSSVFCQVFNDFGEISSRSAILSVTNNKRPNPVIESPASDMQYVAGDVLSFKGYANDQEEGRLSRDMLTWQIDFHHDDHTHPALSPMTGIEDGIYNIPTLGEVSDNVWYRVYLTATDGGGLSNTTFRDVYPEKVNFDITSEPVGVEINVDGRQMETPITITGVRGTVRTLKAPGSFQNAQGLYFFREWQQLGDDQVIQFFADQASFKAIFDFVPFDEGTGLRGHYYENQNRSLGGRTVLERVDPVIDFNWGLNSPHPLVRPDFFTIRWRGKVIPLFDGEHTFYVTSDDGVRLWVADDLIIDDWEPHAALENAGTINLSAGVPVPIRLEFFEDAGDAVVQLSWSHELIRKQIIPRTQLIPEKEVESNTSFGINVIPSVTNGSFTLEIISQTVGRARVYLMDLSGRMVWFDDNVSIIPNVTEIDVDNPALIPGIYILHVTKGEETATKRILVSNP